MTWHVLEPQLLAKVVYPFSKDVPNALKLRIGDTIIVTSRCEDWFYGYSILKSSVSSTSGIFPINHVKIVGEDLSFSDDKRASHEYTNDEIRSTMKTTIAIHSSVMLSYITDLETENDNDTFNECESHLNKLIELYYEIANRSVNREALIKFENQLIYISKLNSLLRCDTALRFKPFNMASVVNLPLIELERLYQTDTSVGTESRAAPSEMKLETSQGVARSSNYCLQILVENFEFIGYSDEFLLQWMIIDTLNDNHYESFWQPIKETKKGRPSWMGEKFIYTDISEEMTKENYYLVVFVYRIGQLLTDPNKQLTSRFRRPLAFGSCSLKKISTTTNKTTIKLNCLNEMDFLKTTKEILRVKYATPVPYRLVEISSTIVDRARIESEVPDESYILRSIVLRSDKPYEYDRNSLYIRLDSAEFEKANKKSPRNIEAQVLILNDKGMRIAYCRNNTDNMTEFLSYVIYHSNSPRWKDIIKVNLSEIYHDECHIFINFYHCSTKDKKADERKYFACCFLKLSEFLESGLSKKVYSLPTQKLSESVKHNPKSYLSKNFNHVLDLEKGPSKEYCKIELFLCSTSISNNKNINSFLDTRYRDDLSIVFIRECLMEIQSLKNEDFLKPKLRHEIMDAVKTLIIDKIYRFESPIETDLFITWQALTYKYIQFNLTPELTTYLKGYHAFLDCLLKGIHYILSTVIKSEISFEVLNITLRSMQPLFEVLSKISDTDYQYDVTYRLKEILKLFLYFFQGEYCPESSNDIRTLILRFTMDNLASLYKLISIDVLIDYFTSLFECTDFKNGKILTKEKLEFFKNLLCSEIHKDCLDILIIWFSPTVDICLMHIDIGSCHLLAATEVMLHLFCQCKILSKEDRMDLMRQSSVKAIFSQVCNVYTLRYYSDVEKLKYTSIADDSDKIKKKYDKNAKNSKMIETKFSVESIKLCTLLVAYLDEWVDMDSANISLKENGFLLENMRRILERNIYPSQWLSMHLKVSSICGAILKKICRCFANNNTEAYDTLTLSYFDACFSYIMQGGLQLQNYPYAKSQEILKKYGDLRDDIMNCFLSVWKNKPSNLEIFDKNFIVQVTRKVLNISFISTPAIRLKTMPMFIHTITNWLDKCGDRNEVLTDLISETELLLRDGRCDVTYYETLNQILELKRMSPDVEEVIQSFAMLINLHLEYRKISSGSFTVLHMEFLLYEFMKFFQVTVGIFTHFQYYSNKFSQLLESEEHFFEAALVLKQQYDCIHRESDEVPFDNIFYKNYDGIGNEQLKEQLGKRIMELLNQAKEYEYAAELCQELHSYYLNEYKYKELNPLLKQWAQYLELIMTEQRLMLNYYRVTFIGGKLPSYMRDSRDYIVKGSIWFKTTTIMTLLQKSFPDSKIKVYQSTQPTESQNDTSMTIYLAKMEPIPSDLDLIRNTKISLRIRRFFKDHKVNRFFSDHPYHKGVIDKNNEVKSLYVSRVTVITDMMMPNEFMWHPIIYEEREIFTPLDVAIDTVDRKNTVIREMIQELEETPSNDMRPFTMLLNGTLDAGVNGGMPKYIEAFFSEPCEGMNFNLDLLSCFRNVLLEQKDVLTEALVLHKKLAPPAILPMHERLEERLNYLKKSVIDLDVARKRSFSTMRGIDDIYAQFHDIMTKGSCELEESSNYDREKVPLRDMTVSTSSPFFTGISETCQSSNCSSTHRDNMSTVSRSACNSQTELDTDKTNIGRQQSPRRKRSSSNEENLTKLAKQYVKQQKSLVMSPAKSTSDFDPFQSSVSVDESKNQPTMSPPLPPKDSPTQETIEEKPTTGPRKSIKPPFFTFRGKQVKTNNGKLILETKGKARHVTDLFHL